MDTNLCRALKNQSQDKTHSLKTKYSRTRC